MKQKILSHKIVSLFFILSLALFATNKQLTFSMTDINGVKYTVKNTDQGLDISGMKDKVVFLEFFGHNCPPCLASIPHLINLQNKYKDKLVIMAIEVQGYSTQQLKKFAQFKKMNYIAISEKTASGVVSHIQQRAQWRGSIPFLVAMDRNGDVQFVQAGMLPETALDKLIQRLMKKTSPVKK